MSPRIVLLAALFGALANGCTPSPSDTCKRLEDLGAKDPAGFKLSMSKCMDRMNEMKERDPEAYKCAARTVAKLTSIDTALLAVSVCDTKKNKTD
ncbi:MAG: hypothetical protein ACXVEF_36310 [Polyangiales bacterium]